RGRTNRCTDDKPIAAVTGYHFAIENEVELDHAEGRSGLQGNLVEAENGSLIAERLDDALEHQVFGDTIFAAHHARKDAAQFIGAEIGEETEPAKIDTKDRRL